MSRSQASELGRIGGRKNRSAAPGTFDPLLKLETTLELQQTVAKLIVVGAVCPAPCLPQANWGLPTSSPGVLPLVR